MYSQTGWADRAEVFRIVKGGVYPSPSVLGVGDRIPHLPWERGLQRWIRLTYPLHRITTRPIPHGLIYTKVFHEV